MSAASDNLRSNQRQLDADGCEVGVSRQAVDETLEEIERLRQWVADLQSGMYVNCVYCGHRYGPGETTPVSMADALKAHISQCPEHPMAECLIALRDCKKMLLTVASFQEDLDIRKEMKEQARIAETVIAKSLAPSPAQREKP